MSQVPNTEHNGNEVYQVLQFMFSGILCQKQVGLPVSLAQHTYIGRFSGQTLKNDCYYKELGTASSEVPVCAVP